MSTCALQCEIRKIHFSVSEKCASYAYVSIMYKCISDIVNGLMYISWKRFILLTCLLSPDKVGGI